MRIDRALHAQTPPAAKKRRRKAANPSTDQPSARLAPASMRDGFKNPKRRPRVSLGEFGSAE
jgi:hypothetical protein